jgi:hypothetical protein
MPDSEIGHLALAGVPNHGMNAAFSCGSASNSYKVAARAEMPCSTQPEAVATPTMK